MRDAIQRQRLERRLALLLAAAFLLLAWLIHQFSQQSSRSDSAAIIPAATSTEPDR